MQNMQSVKIKYFIFTYRSLFLRFLIAIILLITSCGCLWAASVWPAFAQNYSVIVYPVLVSTIGRFFGQFPFSVVEFLLYLLLLLVILSLVFCICRMLHAYIATHHKQPLPYHQRQTASAFSCPHSPTYVFISWLCSVGLFLSFLFFCYTFGCGINYYRTSFTEEEDISTAVYTVDELAQTCAWLTENVDLLYSAVLRNDDNVMICSGDASSVAVTSMRLLSETYDSLAGYYPLPKKIFLSEILSWQSVTGIYSPFTIEANYNGDMTGYNIPFTMCHELSHLRGFMNEKEANFIAFLACTGSTDVSFQYSGYLSGWVYCMNALYSTDYESWKKLYDTLPDEVRADLSANNAFWASYEGTVSQVHEKVNDTYLKANGQSEGTKSYGRIVDLIVTYYLSCI